MLETYRRKRLIKGRDAAASSADVTVDRPESVAREPAQNTGNLPLFVEPQACLPTATVPDGPGWFHEVKLDGYRMLGRLQGGKVQWLSRRNQDWTAKLRTLAAALAALPAVQALIDGEVVAYDAQGRSDFQRLTTALGSGSDEGLRYLAFDLLHLDGLDLRALPLRERKARLRDLLGSGGRIQFVDHVEDHGPEFFRQACALGLEGTIAKRAESPYRSARNGDWRKAKCRARQELVIVGWTESAGARPGLGALLLAVRERDGWRYAGKVGSGFDARTATDLRARLERLHRAEPVVTAPPAVRKAARWVEPSLVAEVAFAGWTRAGLLRHPSFQGLREDKPARDVVREEPAQVPAGPAQVAGVTITNPGRVVFPGIGLTKLAVALHYERVAERMLPELVHRPLTIVRCPEGLSRPCFYQKHGGPAFGPEVRTAELEQSDGRATYVYVTGVAGLISLVQAGALELHPWNARIDRLEQPDRLVFDLDPDPALPWARVVEGALRVREVLRALDLESFPRVTGGKGIHVVAPIRRRHPWDVVRAFAGAVVATLAQQEPARYTVNVRKSERPGRIYLDALRNARGATAVASWSTRARPGAPVAVPVTWDELEPLGRGDGLHVGDLAERLLTDAWAGAAELRQGISAASLRALSIG